MRFHTTELVGALMLAGMACVGAEDDVLKAQPVEISAGASTLLTWQIDGTPSVYLSGVGLVQGAGSRQVTPPLTTDYFLIAQDGKAIAIHSVRVIVNGTKGGDEFPTDLNRFVYPVSMTTSTTFVEFLEQLHRVLQDTLQFSLREFTEPDGTYVFLTNVSERTSLVQPQEKTIGARRIGFRVDVPKPDELKDQLTFEIRTMIDYRRRVERTWRPETDDKLHRAQAELVRQNIESERNRSDRK